MQAGGRDPTWPSPQAESIPPLLHEHGLHCPCSQSGGYSCMGRRGRGPAAREGWGPVGSLLLSKPLALEKPLRTQDWLSLPQPWDMCT